uniref:28S ribosomal protein S9, mitochondrial n=1 Tax=Glossina palpalis gambiensis TaxID=67801 RepID=A0A1B0BY70_9MUSC
MSLRVFTLNLIKANKNVFQNNQWINGALFRTDRFASTEVNAAPLAVKTQKISKAMKAYLERAHEHDQFMKTQQLEYQIGKRHLANMMGEDAETFTQEDINNAIEYLFPSGLYEKKARPSMRPPEEVFPARKAAEFDETGRPFHSFFYTEKPNFFKMLYDIVEELNKLYDLEERLLCRGQKADPNQKIDLTGVAWISKDQLELRLVERLADIEYDNFVNVMNRLIAHPFSYKCKAFIDEHTRPLMTQSAQVEIPKPQIDADGRQYITTYECLRKTARGDVTVRVPGTGKVSINSQDITYFEDIQPREQVSVGIFSLLFYGIMSDPSSIGPASCDSIFKYFQE